MKKILILPIFLITALTSSNALSRDFPHIRPQLEAKVITINTKDQKGCKQLQLILGFDRSGCEYQLDSPFVSLWISRPLPFNEFSDRFYDPSFRLNSKQRKALQSVKDFAVIGTGIFGVLYAMPEKVTKWDKSKGFVELASQYTTRVHQGPVIDKDEWWINYIGHPLSGAAYYTMVRHRGFSAMESATFSFIMSTFLWEYGIEAFAEIPSAQDLILTPLIGSLLGEAFYVWAKRIESNGGKLLGSETLGTAATVLMNPAGALADQINRFANNTQIIKDAHFSLVARPPVFRDPLFVTNQSFALDIFPNNPNRAGIVPPPMRFDVNPKAPIAFLDPEFVKPIEIPFMQNHDRDRYIIDQRNGQLMIKVHEYVVMDPNTYEMRLAYTPERKKQKKNPGYEVGTIGFQMQFRF